MHIKVSQVLSYLAKGCILGRWTRIEVKAQCNVVVETSVWRSAFCGFGIILSLMMTINLKEAFMLSAMVKVGAALLPVLGG